MGGGKTSQSSQADPETKKTTKLTREGVLEPTIGAFMPQFLQTLLTGGVGGSQAPVVQSQVGGIRSGTSNAMDAIKNMLAKAGLLGTPFGARQMADTMQQGEVAASGVGPGMAAELFRLAPNLMTGSANTIIAGGQGRGTTTQTTTNDPSSMIGQLIGQLGGAGILAYGMCWIAASLYGVESPKVMAARYWIINHWPKHIVSLYVKYGERLSKSRIAVTLLKPFFDNAARQGEKKLYGSK
jgi:hypothetical protein